MRSLQSIGLVGRVQGIQDIFQTPIPGDRNVPPSTRDTTTFKLVTDQLGSNRGTFLACTAYGPAARALVSVRPGTLVGVSAVANTTLLRNVTVDGNPRGDVEWTWFTCREVNILDRLEVEASGDLIPHAGVDETAAPPREEVAAPAPAQEAKAEPATKGRKAGGGLVDAQDKELAGGVG
jgi:hypothetical protein